MTAVKPQPPYVTAYSDEEFDLSLGLAQGPAGPRLAYSDPRADDWRFGVLWPRQAAHVDGRAIFRQMHPLRQRECMLERRCQVCGRSAISSSGMLSWLLPGRPRRGLVCVSKPPVCGNCIPEALNSCPHLHNGRVYTSSDYEPCGVVGLVMAGLGDPDFHEVPLTNGAALAVTLAMALIVRIPDLQLKPIT